MLGLPTVSVLSKAMHSQCNRATWGTVAIKIRDMAGLGHTVAFKKVRMHRNVGKTLVRDRGCRSRRLDRAMIMANETHNTRMERLARGEMTTIGGARLEDVLHNQGLLSIVLKTAETIDHIKMDLLSNNHGSSIHNRASMIMVDRIC